MKFWVVVGDANTRKSSTIRALTGVGQRQPNWRIGLVGNQEVRAFVELSAPQERDHPLSPSDFVALVERETERLETTHVLVALRHDGTPKLAVDAVGFIDHFVRVAGWQVLGIGLTGDSRPLAPFAGYDPAAFSVKVDLPPYDAPNVIADQFRAKWHLV